jgi:hypothetical protein
MKTTTKTKPDPRREAAAALDAAQAQAQKPAELGGPFDLSPAQFAELARTAYGLAGFEAHAADAQAARVAGLAETIAQADDVTRGYLTRALLFAASAEWAKTNNRKAVKDLAGRAAAEFSRATHGRRAAEIAAQS